MRSGLHDVVKASIAGSIVGSLMMIPAHLIMGITHWNPLPSMIVLGAAFVLVPAAMWPSVPLVVEEKRVGTAFGLMTAIQNMYGDQKAKPVTRQYTYDKPAIQWLIRSPSV